MNLIIVPDETSVNDIECEVAFAELKPLMDDVQRRPLPAHSDVLAVLQ